MVRNVTLSAEESLLERARERAGREQRSLNDAFREWLTRYAGADREDAYEDLMDRLAEVRSGRHFSRDELNER